MKPLIGTALKGKIQSLLESEMNTACSIYKRGTATADGMGGYSYGTPVLVESTVCFIGELGASTQERQIAAQNTESVLFTLRLPHDADIDKNYWFIAGGLTYHILGYLESDLNVYKKVVVRLDR